MDEAVAVVGLARLEPGLHAGERLVTPLGELVGGDAERAAERVERLAAEEPQDDLGLAAAGPASLVLAVAFVGSARAPRSLRRRRRLVSWLLHGDVHCALESQMGVSGNCAAHQLGSLEYNKIGVFTNDHDLAPSQDDDLPPRPRRRPSRQHAWHRLRSTSLRSPALRHRRAVIEHLPCSNPHTGWTDERDPRQGSPSTAKVGSCAETAGCQGAPASPIGYHALEVPSTDSSCRPVPIKFAVAV